jgi:hypothetical protein
MRGRDGSHAALGRPPTRHTHSAQRTGSAGGSIGGGGGSTNSLTRLVTQQQQQAPPTAVA